MGVEMTKAITKHDFLTKVFDYENNKEWKFEGDKPAIIDFWAEWCAPCRMLGPVLEELSEEYKDQIDIYKVNTENEQELAAAFGIQSIPSLLFIPLNDKPQMAAGALPKDSLVKIIEDVLKVEPVLQKA